MSARRLFPAAVGVLLLAVTVPGANAMELQFTATTATTISVPSGQGRLLLAFPSISALHDEWITDATLTIPITGTLSSDVEVEVDAIATSWGAGATWTSPWQTAGGDRETSVAQTGVLRAGAVTSVDVTDLVRAMTEGEIEEHGFLLLPMNPVSIGFASSDLAVLGTAANQADLTVRYRKLTGLGYEGGPKALLARVRQARAEDASRGR